MSLVVTGSELTAIGRSRYPFAYVRALDIDYNIPTEESVEVFDTELGQLLFDLYGDKWQTFFDCENFALEAVVLACRKHWVSRYAGKGNAQGVAFGLLCFNTVPVDLNTGHCIAVRLNHQKCLVEFEPQNRLKSPLTPVQCLSASLCLFF